MGLPFGATNHEDPEGNESDEDHRAEHKDAKVKNPLPDCRNERGDEYQEEKHLGYPIHYVEFLISFPSCHNCLDCRYDLGCSIQHN